MGLTERHWFENEEPELTDRQLEDIVYENKKAYDNGYAKGFHDALAILKDREGYVSIPFSWLVKFCTHIDFAEPLTDTEREVAWRQKLTQQFGIDVS